MLSPGSPSEPFRRPFRAFPAKLREAYVEGSKRRRLNGSEGNPATDNRPGALLPGLRLGGERRGEEATAIVLMNALRSITESAHQPAEGVTAGSSSGAL